MPIYHAGRLVFGLAGASVTVAILLLAFECAPVHKKLFTVYEYDANPPFGRGLDHQWLGFFQQETGRPFSKYNAGSPDPFRYYGEGRPIKLFDPRGEWLINHQNARPYGDETVPRTEESSGGAGAAGGQQGAGGQGGGPGAPPG